VEVWVGWGGWRGGKRKIGGLMMWIGVEIFVGEGGDSRVFGKI
jgi:hypothetical protein